MLSAMLFVMASCTTDRMDEELPVENPDEEVTDEMSQSTILPADQSRIIYRQAVDAYNATRAVTRVGERADDEHPFVERTPAPQVQDLLDSGVEKYDVNKIYSASSMIITEDMASGTYRVGNLKNLYIARSGVTLSEMYGNNPINIYILDGVTYNTNGELTRNASYYVWGDIATGDNFKMNDGSALYYYNEELKFNNLTMYSGVLKCWGELTISGKLEMSSNGSAPCGFYYYGGKDLDIYEFNLSDPNSPYWFESHAAVYFHGKTTIRKGNYWFGEDVTYDEIYFQSNGDIDITYKACARINKLTLSASSTMNFNVEYFLELPGGWSFENIGAKFNINLDNAVLVIGGEANDTSERWPNTFRKPEHCIYGRGNSAVFIQKSVRVHKESTNNSKVTNFKIGSGKPDVPKSGEDKLAVFGNRYYDNSLEKWITDPPVILVMANDDTFSDYGYDTPFADEGILTDKGEIPDDFIIDKRGEGDCRADYTWGETTPPVSGVLPFHKYSATSIDFSDDGKYVFVSWHSNLPGGETQDGFGEHDHGTNMDPNNKDENYGGPSVEDADDWGGIVDIIQIAGYNPEDGEAYLKIVRSFINSEFKYNHIKQFGDRLYLAATSYKIGAALHVVPLETATATAENLVEWDFDLPRAYRVSLTGKSANCVEVVDDKYLVTTSGRTEGGINWFSLTDESSQKKKYKNKAASTVDYGGKYVCDDGEYIYALHNTSKASVAKYDRSGNELADTPLKTYNGKDVSLVPYDGKNAMLINGGKLYVCCGRNGFHVFNMSDWSEVGYSNTTANCLDVDGNGYIYVATGGGIAVFKEGMFKEGTKEYSKLNSVAYTGKGFKYPNNAVIPEGTDKQSSNFVRVRDGKVFVAYGMFGLRIYSVSELLNKK